MSETVGVGTPSEPIFTLDLGENGGLLAPRTPGDLLEWLNKELEFWQWAGAKKYGPHEAGASMALHLLRTAVNATTSVTTLLPHEHQAHWEAARSAIMQAFQMRLLPHSSTPVARRIERFRQEAGARAASYYLAAFISQLDMPQIIAPREEDTWRGTIAGMVDRYSIATHVSEERVISTQQALDQLRANTESFVADKRIVVEQLHRSFDSIERDARELISAYSKAFKDELAARETATANLVKGHEERMAAIEDAFREQMGLRAPVDYWTAKRGLHSKMAARLGTLTFGAILVVLFAIYLAAGWLLAGVKPNELPPTWKISTLILAAILVIWALRLTMRIYLSHIHLGADAEERVVMVKTYLALIEANALSSDSQRQLILAALFRQAATGIVQDEGFPVSALEALTRQK